MALLTRTGLRINRYCSMAYFSFFKMASVRHLGFSKVGNFNYRSTTEAQNASSCQISRRSVETLGRYGRLSTFKIAANFNLVLRANVHHRTNFREDGSNRSGWPIFDFSIWRPSAILDLFYACWDHPPRVFGGLCDCAKLGCNRCSNFDSIQILIFCTLSLKMPIHAPKIGVFGDCTPKWGAV